jgi:Na+-transporting NADH:ubiquinone oxidoreductase subunit B/electron transport complex protein RnfD
MKPVRLIMDRLYNVKLLSNNLKPVLDALDAALFGTDETTRATPHIVDHLDIKRYMSFVIIALVPAALASIYFYGLRVLIMFAVSYAVGGLVEVIFAIARKKEIHEGFLVTGLIFPLVLPPTTPLWVVAVGVSFGVLFGKEVFGGTGRNIFNPALIGRLFITIAFPAIMTTAWLMPFSDTITSATPLTVYKSTNTVTPYIRLLLGQSAGSMGETFRLGIILGGLFLMFSKVSNWRVPVSYMGSVILFSLIGNNFLPARVAPPLFQLLTGGLLFGAMFMATDPVTSPFTQVGRYSFGILCGLLTVLIRSFSGYVEGVMFSIVIMNAFTPLIDHIVIAFRFPRTRRPER